jgi:hypothetical protein
MRVIETAIPGRLEIEPLVHRDQRQRGCGGAILPADQLSHATGRTRNPDPSPIRRSGGT